MKLANNVFARSDQINLINESIAFVDFLQSGANFGLNFATSNDPLYIYIIFRLPDIRRFSRIRKWSSSVAPAKY